MKTKTHRRDTLKGVRKVLNTEVIIDDCYKDALDEKALPFLNAHIKRLTKDEANEKMAVLVEVASLELARSELLKKGVLSPKYLWDKDCAVLISNFNRLLQKLHECYRILGVKAPTRTDNAKKSRKIERDILDKHEKIKDDDLILS